MDIWNVGMLPFVFASLKQPTNDKLPDFLPLKLRVDNTSGLIIQEPCEEVETALRQAYVSGTIIPGGMDDKGIGKQYAENFLDYLRSTLNRDSFEGIKVLEVGCGIGYLLYRLKQLGAEVIGIDPGAYSKNGASKYQIPIVQDFFPSSRIDERFDLLIACSFLEHIQNCDDILRKMQAYLNDDGIIALSVPDCEPFLKAGDASILFHEHWNYFTEGSLRSIVNIALRLTANIVKSPFGSSLYATIKKSPFMDIDISTEIKKSKKIFDRFISLHERNINRLTEFLQRTQDNGKTIGIYVPSRVINAFAIIKRKIKTNHIRFFDDNEEMQRTYFPGFNIPIESRSDLLASPPDVTLVMSLSFGEKICKELKNAGVASRIVTWQDIFLTA